MEPGAVCRAHGGPGRRRRRRRQSRRLARPGHRSADGRHAHRGALQRGLAHARDGDALRQPVEAGRARGPESRRAPRPRRPQQLRRSGRLRLRRQGERAALVRRGGRDRVAARVRAAGRPRDRRLHLGRAGRPPGRAADHGAGGRRAQRLGHALRARLVRRRAALVPRGRRTARFRSRRLRRRRAHGPRRGHEQRASRAPERERRAHGAGAGHRDQPVRPRRRRRRHERGRRHGRGAGEGPARRGPRADLSWQRDGRPRTRRLPAVGQQHERTRRRRLHGRRRPGRGRGERGHGRSVVLQGQRPGRPCCRDDDLARRRNGAPRARGRGPGPRRQARPGGGAVGDEHRESAVRQRRRHLRRRRAATRHGPLARGHRGCRPQRRQLAGHRHGRQRGERGVGDPAKRRGGLHLPPAHRLRRGHEPVGGRAAEPRGQRGARHRRHQERELRRAEAERAAQRRRRGLPLPARRLPGPQLAAGNHAFRLRLRRASGPGRAVPQRGRGGRARPAPALPLGRRESGRARHAARRRGGRLRRRRRPRPRRRQQRR